MDVYNTLNNTTNILSFMLCYVILCSFECNINGMTWFDLTWHLLGVLASGVLAQVTVRLGVFTLQRQEAIQGN
jgi:hypothetical protein